MKQVSLRFTCSIFWELFRNSRTRCPHIQQLLNHKTIKRLRPWFFCVSSVSSVPVTFNKEIKKLLFLPSKITRGVDLYTGSTYTRVNTVHVKYAHARLQLFSKSVGTAVHVAAVQQLLTLMALYACPNNYYARVSWIPISWSPILF